MPLPSLLASRLAKRGLLKASGQDSDAHSDAHETKRTRIADLSPRREEVIAESYDSPESLHHLEVEEVANCPDRLKSTHVCDEGCKQRYGLMEYHPDLKVERNRLRMLKRYPLPWNWKEIADPRSNRCYYWNVETDLVSWLPPNHPRAVITASAFSTFRSSDTPRTSGCLVENGSPGDRDLDTFSAIPKGSKIVKPFPLDTPPQAYPTSIVHYESKPVKARPARRAPDSLDPMDPSSYSNTPKGGWSSGLSLKGKAKTGVDETASGPLYQMRPYPSPGSVLKLNKTVDDSPP